MAFAAGMKGAASVDAVAQELLRMPGAEPVHDLVAVALCFWGAGFGIALVVMPIVMLAYDFADWLLDRFAIAPVPADLRAPPMIFPSRWLRNGHGDNTIGFH